MTRAEVLVGDVRQRLAELTDGSVRCVVTSPPYWGLRDYGHEGQIGLEQTPDAYVAELVEVFREVRRVLADDGTLWVNLGDSYSGSGKGAWGSREAAEANRHRVKEAYIPTRDESPLAGNVPEGLKPKDLVGIPWRVAFALQADGWWLRQDIIWAKPNPMPESVTDRCTKAHEYLFLLSKSPRYYFDAEAIAEASVVETAKAAHPFGGTKYGDSNEKEFATKSGNSYLATGTRNKRSVWSVTTEPFPGAHFAVMPTQLVEPCILAGSARGDTILDPFAGSGTVGVVALRHGRDFVGVELNPEYAAMAETRIHDDGPLFNETRIA